MTEPTSRLEVAEKVAYDVLTRMLYAVPVDRRFRAHWEVGSDTWRVLVPLIDIALTDIDIDKAEPTMFALPVKFVDGWHLSFGE